MNHKFKKSHSVFVAYLKTIIYIHKISIYINSIA